MSAYIYGRNSTCPLPRESAAVGFRAFGVPGGSLAAQKRTKLVGTKVEAAFKFVVTLALTGLERGNSCHV